MRRIITLRNDMVHRHIEPELINVKNAIDVSELFYYATNRLSRLFVTTLEVKGGDEEFKLDYNYAQNEITITMWGKEIILERENKFSIQKEGKPVLPVLYPTSPQYETFEFTYTYPEENFCKWLGFLVKIQS